MRRALRPAGGGGGGEKERGQGATSDRIFVRFTLFRTAFLTSRKYPREKIRRPLDSCGSRCFPTTPTLLLFSEKKTTPTL